MVILLKYINEIGPSIMITLQLWRILVNNYSQYKVWDKITYSFPNFNSKTVEGCEWISNLMSYFTGHVITYPCWN